MIRVYTVYDKVAQKYNPPFVSENDESAKRGFFHACKTSPFGSDFSLFYIGEFGDLETGKILPDYQFVCNAPSEVKD